MSWEMVGVAQGRWRWLHRLRALALAASVLLLVTSCSSGGEPAATPAPSKECTADEACAGCECPAGLRCHSPSAPCREPCDSSGDKAGEYYCSDGYKVPCSEYLETRSGWSAACTVCGCWDGFYCVAATCKPHKADGMSCDKAEDCEDSCCRTADSPDQDVCSPRGSCRNGIGEICASNDGCPAGAICTENGFCTAGCDANSDCGTNSETGGNRCIAGNFNTYTGYFPGSGGICVPGCNRDRGDADCAPWNVECELHYGFPSWCTPVLP